MSRKSPHRQPTLKNAAARKQWLMTTDRICGFCGAPGSDTVDHTIPLARGGTDTPDNWRPAHRTCNSRAGAIMENKRRGRARAAIKQATQDTEDGQLLRGVKEPRNSDSEPSPRRRGRDYRERLPEGPRGPERPQKPRRQGGMVLPRLETVRPRRKLASLGPEAIEWLNASGVMGQWSLLPWQEYCLNRALEVRKDGSLRWRVVIITVARQQGKSVMMRALAWWRIHQAARFGEPQIILSTANVAATAREVWRPAALHALDRYGKKAAKFGKGQEELELPGSDGRWIVQAAGPNTGVGYSLSMALIDEAWNVDRGIVDEAITPATSEREQPQIWLVSTAGDSSSDLLRSYREMALQDTDGSGDVLLLEWSAPPEADYSSEATWKWASPHWSDRRTKFLNAQLQAIPESGFRTQYMNQWVASIDGWIPASVWAAGFDNRKPPTEPPTVTAVEIAPDGARFAVVNAWEVEDGKIYISSWLTKSSSALWERLEQLEPKVLLLPPQLMIHYRGRKPAHQVGHMELHRQLLGVGRALSDGQILHHKDDHNLNDHVSVAVATHTEGGMKISTRKSQGPIEACRAMIWAVGEVMRPSQPRPKVMTA